MAPISIAESLPLKRTSSQAQLDDPDPKKQARSAGPAAVQSNDSHHQHALQETTFRDAPTTSTLLTRSIGLTAEAVGFGSVAPDALESFRQLTEAYMQNFLSTVRQYMTASRRTRVIPQDFLQSLHTKQLSLRALLPHLDPPVPSSQSKISLRHQKADKEAQAAYRPASSLFTTSTAALPRSYIPNHFPKLPDAHTYQDTPEYVQREQDPQRIRERIVEEGQLAERALRRLVNAAKRPVGGDEDSIAAAEGSAVAKVRRKKPSLKEQRQQAWARVVAAVAADEASASDTVMRETGETDSSALPLGLKPVRLGGLSSVVNADKAYWRKPVERRI